MEKPREELISEVEFRGRLTKQLSLIKTKRNSREERTSEWRGVARLLLQWTQLDQYSLISRMVKFGGISHSALGNLFDNFSGIGLENEAALLTLLEGLAQGNLSLDVFVRINCSPLEDAVESLQNKVRIKCMARKAPRSNILGIRLAFQREVASVLGIEHVDLHDGLQRLERVRLGRVVLLARHLKERFGIALDPRDLFSGDPVFTEDKRAVIEDHYESADKPSPGPDYFVTGRVWSRRANNVVERLSLMRRR